jgi:hypothetical protein
MRRDDGGEEFAENADAFDGAAGEADGGLDEFAAAVAEFGGVAGELVDAVVAAEIHGAAAGGERDGLVGDADGGVEGLVVAEGDEAILRAVENDDLVVEGGGRRVELGVAERIVGAGVDEPPPGFGVGALDAAVARDAVAVLGVQGHAPVAGKFREDAADDGVEVDPGLAVVAAEGGSGFVQRDEDVLGERVERRVGGKRERAAEEVGAAMNDGAAVDGVDAELEPFGDVVDGGGEVAAAALATAVDEVGTVEGVGEAGRKIEEIGVAHALATGEGGELVGGGGAGRDGGDGRRAGAEERRAVEADDVGRGAIEEIGGRGAGGGMTADVAELGFDGRSGFGDCRAKTDTQFVVEERFAVLERGGELGGVVVGERVAVGGGELGARDGGAENDVDDAADGIAAVEGGGGDGEDLDAIDEGDGDEVDVGRRRALIDDEDFRHATAVDEDDGFVAGEAAEREVEAAAFEEIAAAALLGRRFGGMGVENVALEEAVEVHGAAAGDLLAVVDGVG